MGERTCANCRSAGCQICRGTGYHGRVGLFELVTITDDMRDAIASRAPRSRMRALAAESGMMTLAEDGWRKAQLGLTTVEEVARVVQS